MKFDWMIDKDENGEAEPRMDANGHEFLECGMHGILPYNYSMIACFLHSYVFASIRG